MKRSIVSFFLLVCFILSIGGAYNLLLVRRQVVRREVKQRLIASLDRRELVKHVFTGNELKSLQIDKVRNEFEKNGLMFDIVYSIEKKDTAIFWCWPDRQETELNHRLDQVADMAFGTDKKSRGVQNVFIYFLSNLYFEEDLSSHYYLAETTVIHSDHPDVPVVPVLLTDTPPPRS